MKPLYDEHPNLLEFFLANVAKAGLSDYVSAYRGTVETFMSQLSDDVQFRVAFLDGDHSYEALTKDIKAVTSRLVPGGWICFDDAFSYYDGVDSAIRDNIINSDEFIHYQQMTRNFL